jgi:hypothetical protein
MYEANTLNVDERSIDTHDETVVVLLPKKAVNDEQKL